MAKSIATTRKESHWRSFSLRAVASDAPKKVCFRLVESGTVRAQYVVEPDFRFGLRLFVEPTPPGIDRLRLATDQTPIDRADPFSTEDRELRLEAISKASREVFRAQERAFGLDSQLIDQILEFLWAAVVMERDDVGPFELQRPNCRRHGLDRIEPEARRQRLARVAIVRPVEDIAK